MLEWRSKLDDRTTNKIGNEKGEGIKEREIRSDGRIFLGICICDTKGLFFSFPFWRREEKKEEGMGK